jgi:hypothetical protein
VPAGVTREFGLGDATLTRLGKPTDTCRASVCSIDLHGILAVSALMVVSDYSRRAPIALY